MRSIIYVLGIIASIICLYYQALALVFNDLTLSSRREYPNMFVTEVFPRLLTLLIILIFLTLNIRWLILSFKRK